MDTVGIGLIVRNSEKTIEACIESFINDVDQCVVVKAGESVDKTEKILAELKAKYKNIELYDFQWVDDFSAARNYAFSKLNTDWLLWCDADDQIYQAENLHQLAQNAKDEVGAIWFPYHYATDEFGNVTTVYERERLLRASYGWIWKGRLHETVSPLTQCKLVRTEDVIIRHNHTVGGDRNERNFNLLYKMQKEDPDDKRVWLYLGHQNFAANNWEQAAEWYLKFGSDKSAIAIERYQSLCYCVKAMRTIRDRQAIDVALMAIELFPSYKDAYLEMAQCYLLSEDWDKVIHWCNMADVKELIVEPPAIIFVNPLDYTFNKYAMLSEAYRKKGDWEKATEYMKICASIRPTIEIKDQAELLNAYHNRERTADSIKIQAVDLLNNREILKLQNLLDSTPYWFRDSDDYVTFATAVAHYLSEAKEEKRIIEGENNSALVDVGFVKDPEKMLDEMDKYDKVTVVSSYSTSEGKQIRVYSQRDMEDLIMSRPNRHLINLRKDNNRIICEYDHKEPKDLAVRIFLGQGLEEWSPQTIMETGCGGSETAAAWVAREFAKRNCQPIIYAMNNEVWDGVLYRHFSNYRPTGIPCHLFISSRQPDVFHENIPAQQRWLWCHDIHRWDMLTPEVCFNIDVIVVLSKWHANFTKATYPFLKEAEVIDMDNNPLTYDDCVAPNVWYAGAKCAKLPKIAIIGDAIDTERFNIKEKRVKHRFIWCSSPDRGLEQVLTLWPMLRKELPDAELKIFYGWDYFNNYLAIPEMRDFKRNLLQIIKQEGVEWCGRVGQQQLARELMRAEAMIYPPPHDFRETYGIAFLEAQAARCICFYRQNGALGETIGDRGIPLPLDCSQEQIVRTIVDTLSDKSLCAIIKKKAHSYAMKRTWGRQAEKFLALYRRLQDE